MTSPRLCISTLDPTNSGGVGSMVRFVYETAEKGGYDPFLVCNRVSRETDVRIQDIVAGDWSRQVESTTFEGMETVFVPRYLPEFEFLQYILNKSHWNQSLLDADLYFSVSGHIHSCQPLSRIDQPFGCWVATLFWDERKVRLKNESLPMRSRHLLSKPFLERIEGHLYEDADVVYSLSEHTAKRIRQRHGVDESRIKVVPYPIDTSRFTPGEEETHTKSNPTVLFVGRFNAARKNTPLLLRAFSRVRREVPKAQLQLIGDEPSDQLRELSTKLGINNAVEFINFVPNEQLPEYYRKSNVFVIPSQQEGLGIVGLEAMACGTPVVATQCGGPEDYVVDGETGVLIPRDDLDTMATGLIRLLTDDRYRGELGESARDLVEDRYAKDELESQFMDIFKEIKNIKTD